MSYDKSVADHYLHGSLLNAIEKGLTALGKTIETVTIEDLAAIDEFHIGGRIATDNLFRQLNFSKPRHLLDVGCGLGGAARYVASIYQHTVAGIDLTPEYIEAGNTLCEWLSLDSHVSLVEGSALSMPYNDSVFDGGYMLHVGMNIEDKVSLFAEIFRVLKPGAVFAVYDIMRQKDGELTYPVPWATGSSISKLSTPGNYKEALRKAGFEIIQENNRRDFSLDFFKKMRQKVDANQGLPPLGLHILMQQSAAKKVANMLENIKNNLIAPVEMIALKR